MPDFELASEIEQPIPSDKAEAEGMLPTPTALDALGQTSYPLAETTYRKRTTKQERFAQLALMNEVQTLVDNTDAPFFEVAGPSRRGFTSLHDVLLPNGLVISNVYLAANVDMLADARQLPIADKSIGGILVSYLDKMTHRDAIDPRTGLVDMYAYSYLQGIMDELYDDTLRGDYESWHNRGLHDYALRVALLSEARRVLRPGGLFIIRGAEELELSLAECLGFDYKLGIADREDLPLKANVDENEYVLQLNRMQTGAGLAIESRDF